MLLHMSLKDFAVVSASQLAFSPGFTVVTGETGAGKSLLVDALLCLTGTRAEGGMVRHGAERAELSAEFGLGDAPEALAWLQHNAYDDGRDCLIRRVIRADGGSKAWINGRNATLSQLSELGACLLEIHGQHEQQSLLERRKQLGLLDDFGQTGNMAKSVQQAYRHWLDVRQQLDALHARGDVSERMEYLQHQLAELRRQPLEPELIETAVTRHKRHSQSAQLMAACASAAQLLDGDDDGSALGLLRAGMVQIGRWQDSDAGLAEVHGMLESADVQMKEALSQLRHLQEGIELDPAEIAELEAQLSHWHDLSRKHRVPLEQLHEKSGELDAELEQLRGAGEKTERLDIALKAAAQTWQQAAETLSQARHRSAAALSAAVSALMDELGMSGGRFVVMLEANDGDAPQAHGLERCEFLVSANPGQPPRALRKVASGGELARISLAIEVATLGLDPTPTMVFDEVDSGIGGAVAEVVGQKLRALGKGCQVLCVTHLAQVASLGHQHYQVHKIIGNDSTESLVTVLDDVRRVEEIARMMGGKALTPQTLAHAKAMLDHAQS
jgi:DNA repair protein RecN (Recombination protein N)